MASNIDAKELSSIFHCKICLKQLTDNKDLNIIERKDDANKFNIAYELEQLSFKIPSTSKFVCRDCKKMIKDRMKCRQAIETIDDRIFRLSHGVEFPEGAMEEEGNTSSTEDNGDRESTVTPIIKSVASLVTPRSATMVKGPFTLSQTNDTTVTNKPLLLAKSDDYVQNSSSPTMVITKKNLLVNKINDNSKVRITENEGGSKNEHDYCQDKTTSKPAVKEIVIGIPSSATMLTPLIKSQLNQPIVVAKPVKTPTLKENKSQPSAPVKPPVRTHNVATQTKESARDLPPPIVNSLHANSTTACIYVKWPSSAKQKVLPKDMTAIGIALLRGNSNDIAKRMWGHDQIKIRIQELYMKDLMKEVDTYCAEKTPSLLRKSTPEDFLAFTFEKLDNELQENCPALRNILKTVAIRKNYEEEAPWMKTICMAASLLLKNRQPKMYALQKMLDMLEDGEKETLPRCLLKHRYIFLPNVMPIVANVMPIVANPNAENSTVN